MQARVEEISSEKQKYPVRFSEHWPVMAEKVPTPSLLSTNEQGTRILA
jgi:hypothetical protein